MKKENAEAISSTLGQVECVEDSRTGDCRGRCIWVRVNLDINQLLCRGHMVNGGGPTPNWVSFQYERMQIFFYWCGNFNHEERDCKLLLNGKATLRKEDQ